MSEAVLQRQNQLMLQWLQHRGERGVAAYEALTMLGIYRAGARVWDLRRAGYHIRTIRHRNRTAVYVLEEA